MPVMLATTTTTTTTTKKKKKKKKEFIDISMTILSSRRFANAVEEWTRIGGHLQRQVLPWPLSSLSSLSDQPRR